MPGTGDGGTGGSGSSAATVADLSNPTSDPACKVSPASFHDYATEADLDALLVRRWKRCIAPQIPGEDVGVEFTADGHYYPLTLSATGELIRRTGVDYEGSWKYFPVGATDPFFGETLTHPDMLLSGVLTDAPQFTDEPRQLRILFSPVPGKYLPIDP